MATTTSTRSRRSNGDHYQEAAELGTDATRNAQETVIRALGTGTDTALTVVDVGQKVAREVVSASVAGVQQTLRMSADVLASALGAVHYSLGPWAEGRVAVQGWRRLVDGSAQAIGRFAEEMQGTAQEGTERIKQAVNVLADQVKDSATELGQAAEEQANRTSRAASSKN